MIYLISYVPNLLYDPADIHNFITNHLNPPVDWWHYSGVYLLDTTLTIPQITSSLRGRYPGLQHFVVKVELNDNGGLLPQEAWDWINRKTGARVKFKLKPNPISPLLSTILKSQASKPAAPASFAEILSKIKRS
jgi:hypothetical protein